MMKEENFFPKQEAQRDEEVKKAYEAYIGVCDVYTPEEAGAMAEQLRWGRKDRNRKVMIGVMTHPLALNPDREDPANVREVFPQREELAKGFTDDPDVLNTIHYADLYGPKKGQNLFENLEKCVEYGGKNLHAIQLDVTWPNSDELKKFKSKYPKISIILQVGKFAIKEVDSDPQKLVEHLHEYGDSIDHVLLDMSMGKGKDLDPEGLLAQLRAIRKRLPNIGLAVAGGLGPESLGLLEPIAKEFPDVSIDAQGNVKREGAPKDALGHLLSTEPADPIRSTRYIERASYILDTPQKE